MEVEQENQNTSNLKPYQQYPPLPGENEEEQILPSQMEDEDKGFVMSKGLMIGLGVLVVLLLGVGGVFGKGYWERRAEEAVEIQEEKETVDVTKLDFEDKEAIPEDGIGGYVADQIGQLEKARDSQRRNDLYVITQTIYEFATKNNGDLPDGLSEEKQEIGTAVYDLGAILVPDYMASMPHDPLGGTEAVSGYVVYLNENGRVVAEVESEVNEGEMIVVVR